ncbi:MAG: dihydrolipoyllysine-residue succinyltransferase, partial [Actinobacteria bacterium]|nr:dihydrolipoyllysine-residue succinyltransferase [Actinomycetota bacterium]
MADITLPQLGETVTEGTITRWFKKVGDTVAADEPLFEVSTDKVDTEVPSPVAGTLTEIRVKEGETVSVGTVIAVVGSASASASAGAAPVVAPAPIVAPVAPAPVAQAPVVQPEPIRAAQPVANVATATRTQLPANASNKLLSPVVRRLVADYGIDVNALVGTGPGSRITREDVLDYIDKNGSAPQVINAPAPVASAPAPQVVQASAPVAPAVQAPAPAVQAAKAVAPKLTQSSERETIIPLTKIRKLTAAHMIMSQAVSAHAFSVVEVD